MNDVKVPTLSRTNARQGWGTLRLNAPVVHISDRNGGENLCNKVAQNSTREEVLAILDALAPVRLVVPIRE